MRNFLIMKRIPTNYSHTELKTCIIDALQSKKGHDIIDINLTGLKELLFDDFIICHGDSTVQVSALSEAVEKAVFERFQIKVHHREGVQQAQWILLDYRDLLVHIFLQPVREFYNLEGLYADAPHERFVE